MKTRMLLQGGDETEGRREARSQRVGVFITRKQCGDAGAIMPSLFEKWAWEKELGSKDDKTLAIHGKFSNGGIFTRGVDDL